MMDMTKMLEQTLDGTVSCAVLAQDCAGVTRQVSESACEATQLAGETRTDDKPHVFAEISAENGKPVQFGQTLFRLK